jgi:hypothetical protein
MIGTSRDREWSLEEFKSFFNSFYTLSLAGTIATVKASRALALSTHCTFWPI